MTGIIRIEHTPLRDAARVRVIFAGEPAADTRPKSTPDDESLGAAWVTLDELSHYPLRGQQVEALMQYVAGGGNIYPLTLLQREGMPFFIDDRPND
jgi:phosphatase NudJ